MAPIDTLAEAFRTGNGHVGLNEKFLSDAGTSPPLDFKKELATAFALDTSNPTLDVSYEPANVSPVVNDAFTVTQAEISFLGYPQAKSTVTLSFAQSSGPLAVVIEVALGGDWTWSTTFEAMVGWPFDVLTYDKPTFVFATEPKEKYRWNGSGTVALERGQNFVSAVKPAPLSPTFGLLKGVKLPSILTLAGKVEVDHAQRVGGPQTDGVLAYPNMELAALVTSGEVEVLDGYLTAARPRIGLRVQRETISPEEDGLPPLLESGEPAPAEVTQTPQLLVGLDLKAGDLDVELLAPLLNGDRFALLIGVAPKSDKRLTAAEAIELVAGGKGTSFLSDMPAPLQQFLRSVGLNGLSLSGTLQPKPTLTSVGATLGSTPDTSIVLLDDPTGKQRIAITSFSVMWMLMDPLGPKHTSSVLVSASLEIWPAVFKGHDGKPGSFEISIDQTMRVEGEFKGQVAFSDLLEGVSGGHLQMPKGVSATFSDIDLVLDPSARTYAFGATLDATVDFIKFDKKPLLSIEGMRFELGASTPVTSKGTTVTAYTGSIVGIVAVGPIALAVDVRYDGAAAEPTWALRSELARPLLLGELVDQFLDEYKLPPLIPRTLTVETFSIAAQIPAGKDTQEKSSYAVSGSLKWKIDALDTTVGAKLGLAYDGIQFSGSAIGELTLGPTKVEVGYAFDPATQDTLWIAWEGLRGTYRTGPPKTVTLSAEGWTLGKLVQGLVRGVGPPDFTLDPPWDFLNKISLDGLSIVIDLSTDPPSFSAEYSIGKIDLGFLVIEGIKFSRGKDRRVLLELSGHSTIESLEKSGLFPKDGKAGGRDVKDMPAIPGGGTTLFELWLLALGQRVSLVGTKSFKDIADAVKKLEAAPSTDADSNPVDPEQTTDGQPYYNPSAGWLVAVHFGLLKAGGEYTLECAAVFADPDLYGLHLKFSGEKAKVLAGLELDVLYKKVTDDVGLYQIEFSFPKSLRQIDFGAFSVTLPMITIKIYTNGDFLFDFGFPYNADFSRSFGMSAMIGPVPVVGALGFYFGRLSIGSEAGLPAAYVGTFSPAIVFGVGVTLGVGRYFQKGPLSAGISVTVFGIVEGTIAAWHPEAIESPQPLPPAALPAGALGAGGLTPRGLTAGANASPVQSDYFFRLKGSFGIIGKLYGSVDFVVIKAEVNVSFTLSAQITYESFKDIQLSASASVSISVSLKIDFGLFAIRISFSFSATISVDLTIANSGTPPWARKLSEEAEPAALPAPSLVVAPNFKEVVNVRQQTTVTLFPGPQFTVAAPAGASQSREQGAQATRGMRAAQDAQGAFVFLLAMDAPRADAEDTGTTSFDELCKVLLPWVIDAFVNPLGDKVDLAAIDATSVSRQQLQEIVERLSSSGESVIAERDVERLLLSRACVVNVAERTDGLDGAAIFPPFGGLSLTVPDPDGGGATKTVAFDTYVTITEGYRKRLAELLRELAARVQDESGGKNVAAEAVFAEEPEPLNRFLFEDWFAMVAQQLLQAGADALGDYAYPLTREDSLARIVAWARYCGNPRVDVMDVARPNASHQLTGKVPLTLSGITYVVQGGDSLTTIAARYSDLAGDPRWTTSPAALILANGDVRGLLAPGAEITLDDGVAYTTHAGDSFALVAEGLKITLAALSREATLYPRTDLLASTQTLSVPDIAYRTAITGDTLDSIAVAFDLPLERLARDNSEAQDLFAGDTVQIANLENLLVADVWAVLQRDRRPAQVAGMVSRFALHGVRLPAKEPAGLTLPNGFMYARGEDDYGLYQLSGQQFPTPAFAAGKPPSYSIVLAKDAQLSWLRFAGSTTTASLELKLDAQAQRLAWVLDWTRANGFDPQASVTAQPQVVTQPKRYAARTATPWSTSDVGRLVEIVTPPTTTETPGATGSAPAAHPATTAHAAAAARAAAAAQSAAAAPQVQPILWELPESLLQGVGDRVAKLTAAGFTPNTMASYLPAVRPAVGTTDPATQQTTFTALEDFATATRVQLQIKRLAQNDDLAPQRPDATHIVPPGHGNSGSPSPALAPYCYEVIAPSPTDAVLLEQLLLALADVDPPVLADLFLLLENAPGTAGLTSRGSDEMVAFLTQTNLSTETAPDRVQLFSARAGKKREGIRRGFLNSAHETVKLLWELASTRAGGTYLYYELPDEGAGLPATIFDSSGVATLTLVIAYVREGSLADSARVTGAVNAFFTTTPIDVARSTMSLESCSAPARTRAQDSEWTLGAVAELYGVELGTLGRLNATRELAPVGVPIVGATHQLTEADVQRGAYAAVAAYYSAGAAKALSAADVEKHNPHMSTAAGRTLRVPPVTCVVGSAGAPGKTLAELSGYFGVPIDALAAALVDRAAFAGGVQLDVDSQQHDAHGWLGTGNAGVSVTRPHPDEPQQLGSNPSEQEIDKYARAYLQTLFTLLSVSVEGSPFFTASRPALPSGPRKPLTPEEALAYRHPANRVAALRADALEPLRYEQTVGFGTVSLLNPVAKTEPPPKHLPPRAANPYVGVGSVLELSVGWLDVFGNRPPLAASVSADAQTVPLDIDYCDRLVGLSQWPNVRATYSYNGTAQAPTLTLHLKLDVEAYANAKTGPALAAADAKMFATAYWQLVQDYDTADVQGLNGRAVSLTITDTLLEEPDVPLDHDQTAEVVKFVTACLEYVIARADDGEARASREPQEGPSAAVAIKLTGALSSNDVIPLDVTLRLDRQPLLTDPALRASTGGMSDSTPVLPMTSNVTSDSNVSLHAFATGFEEVFTTSECVLRVGTSAALPGESAATRAVALWAVRTAKTPGAAGLGFSIAKQPSFYAPLSLARTLRNESAEIHTYVTGKPFPDGSEEVMFTGVDLNAWAQTALAAIDGFLTPTYAAPAFLVDQLTVQEPETKEHLSRILEHKKTLAKAIASTAYPILDSSAADGASLQAAAGKLEQALLDQLSAAFRVSAVTVLPIADAHYDGQLANRGVPPRFYGQPVDTTSRKADENAEQNFSLSSAKVPLTTDPAGASRMAFLFDSRNATAATHVPLMVSYAATHLEHDITDVPGIDGYEQSAWIAFVTGPLAPLSGKTAMPIDFPVVLKALPKPPSMVGQTASKAHPDPHTPAQLAGWTYSFSYLYESAAQDTASAVVEWNKPDGNVRGLRDVDADLFAALAQFVTIWPAVEADVEEFVRGLDGTATDAPAGAVSALTALESITGTLAAAYTAWATAGTQQALANRAPQQVVFEFDLRLAKEEDGSARIDVIKQALQPANATVPVPRVKLDTYTEHAMLPPAQGALASWTYKDEHGKPLGYEEARGIAGRTVELAELDVFAFQDASASLRVVRNEEMVPGEQTREEFVFTTPTVAFAQPVVPLLDFASFPLAPENTRAPLEADLEAFFSQLLAGAGGLEVQVKLQAAYAYRLVPKLAELPETVLPIVLLPPTPSSAVPPPFLGTVASAVTSWLADVAATDPQSRLTLGLQVFSGSHATKQMPLLAIGDLSVLRSHLVVAGEE